MLAKFYEICVSFFSHDRRAVAIKIEEIGDKLQIRGLPLLQFHFVRVLTNQKHRI